MEQSPSRHKLWGHGVEQAAHVGGSDVAVCSHGTQTLQPANQVADGDAPVVVSVNLLFVEKLLAFAKMLKQTNEKKTSIEEKC